MDSDILERQLLLDLLAAVNKMSEWSFDDLDDDAQKDINIAISRAGDINNFHKLQETALKRFQYESMQNAFPGRVL